MGQKRYVNICPDCGSINLSQDKTTITLAGATLLTFCKHCQYGYGKGNFFPEIEISKVEEFRKKIKVNKLLVNHKKAKRIKYEGPPMKFDSALMKYVPDLPLKKAKRIK